MALFYPAFFPPPRPKDLLLVEYRLVAEEDRKSQSLEKKGLTCVVVRLCSRLGNRLPTPFKIRYRYSRSLFLNE